VTTLGWQHVSCGRHFETGNGFEDGGVVVSISDAQKLLQKSRQVSAIQVKLQDTQQVDRARARLEQAFPRLIVSQSSQVANQQQIIDVLRGVALGISLLAIIIGGVVMTNTVMMGVFERVHEIGTLRALGWSRRRVLSMVLGESMLLGAAGGALGCLISAVLGDSRSKPNHYAWEPHVAVVIQGMLTAIIWAQWVAFIRGVSSRLLPIEAMGMAVLVSSRITTSAGLESCAPPHRHSDRDQGAQLAVAALGGLMGSHHRIQRTIFGRQYGPGGAPADVTDWPSARLMSEWAGRSPRCRAYRASPDRSRGFRHRKRFLI
jgi:hypothetical protein